MDNEAVFQDDNLSASVSMRRRSHSMSDDYSVQRTNDDATQCKFAAVQLGYWTDNFIRKFAVGCGIEPSVRRDPEISIGYWARVSMVWKVIENFLSKTNGTGQLVNIGCGFDTLYWRLKEDGRKFSKFVDMDFSSVTAKKIRQIRKPGEDFAKFFAGEAHEAQHSDLHCGDYNLVGADIRQWHEVKGKLDACGLDYDAPTLFIAECVLVYISADQSNCLLKELSSAFTQCAFVNYEQFNIDDQFGKVMEQNLTQRGIHLPGLVLCNEIGERDRFLNNGWTHAHVTDMNTVYKNILPASEVKRIENIEQLDEMELLRQLLQHYCITYAYKGDAVDLSFPF